MMKNAPFFSLLMSLVITSTVMIAPLSQAGERRKTLADCPTCKRPVYSYYKFKTFKDQQPVYAWEVSGHSKCGVKVATAQKATQPSVVEKSKTKTAQQKSEHKEKQTERPAYASHDGGRGAYGGGSGYTAGYAGRGYGGGNFGGGNYGNAFHPEYGYGRDTRYSGYEQGYGTVTRRTTVTSPTPARGIFGGFSGTSTRTYTTRTRTSYRGSYSGGRRSYSYGGGGGHGHSHVSHY
ncbi:MAG: hypothetical protein QM496_03595 [Verrucomicrobiota bacterium]